MLYHGASLMPNLVYFLLHLVAFGAGTALVVGTLISVIRTFILPRSAPDFLSRMVFLAVHRLFLIRLRWARTYADQDAVLAFFAPVSLLALLPVWYTTVLLGYMLGYWALGTELYQAFQLSGSSIFTLGYAAVDDLPRSVLSFSEAALGLLLVALLIAYLPTIYAAFSRREAAVTLLEVRAGSPPSAVGMLERYRRIHGLDQLGALWQAWEAWFADVEESHTSLPVLVFFRSPRPEHSWITAAGAVLDAAALTLSAVDLPSDARAALCLRAGYIALRRISDFFSVPYNPNPAPDDPISITRAEYDAACRELASNDIPLKADAEQGWRDFNGWRVNYDAVLLGLAGMTLAPHALWSSDRATNHLGPVLVTKPPRPD
jgi:hypothetical protein